MRQFWTIAVNAFMELVRQPIFLLLMTSSAVFIIFLAAVPYFGYGDDPKLVKDSALAVTFLSGLFGAVLCASSSIAREVRTGTALAVLAKPVGRARFLLAKYFGLAAALGLLTFANLISALLASRMAFDAYGDADLLALKVYFGFLLLAYLAGGFSNYFLRRPFVADTFFLTLLLMTLSFVVLGFFDKEGKVQTFAREIDWRLISAGLLIAFAVWILAGLSLACSTRLDTIPTLAVCTGIFLLGLVSDYLIGRHIAGSHGITHWLLQAAYAVVPNWQNFWLADALEGGQKIPLSYLAKGFGYLAAYVSASLAFALVLFEDRELS